MNKADLVNKIAEKANLKKIEARIALEALIETITQAVSKGEKVSLLGFGSFKVVEKKARMGVNPTSHEKIEIPAKKVVKFQASDEFNALIK